MLLKFKVIAGALWNATNVGFNFFVSLATVVVLARLLKPEDFGLFAMVTVVITIMESLADMGISGAVISYKDIQNTELSSLFYLNILVGFSLTLTLILFSPLIVYYYQEPRLYLYIWLMACYFTIISPATIFNALMKKNMQFATLSKISMATTTLYSCSVILYAYFSRNVMSLVFGMLIQAAVGTSFNVYFGLKIWQPGPFSLHFASIKRFLRFGLYQIGERIVNQLNQNLDNLLIGSFLGAQALGYYSMAYNLMIKPIQRINPIITSVSLPALVEVADNNNQFKKYYLKMIHYICFLMAPFYFLLLVLSKDLILFFYGSKWELSIPVLQIFSLMGILYALWNPFGNLILSKRRPDVGFYYNVSKTLIFFTANFIGLHWGITGVALSSLLVTLLIFEPANFWIRHYLAQMGIKEYLLQIQKPILFSALAAATIMLSHSMLTTLPQLTNIILSGVIFGIIYLILLLVLDKQEILFLKKTVREFLANKQKKTV